MIGHRPRVVAAAALAALGAIGLLRAQQTPTFRAGTNLVTVDAYPLQDNKIVEGLGQDDFEITEDGKPQKVEAFEFVRIEPSPTEAHRDPNTIDEALQLAADPHNRVFVTFLDIHNVRLDGSYYSRAPLVDTLNRILAPNDLFGVMTPRMRPTDLTLGRKTDTVEAELAKYWTWGERGSSKIIPEGRLRDRCYYPPPSGNPDGDYTPILDIQPELIARSWEEQSLTALGDLAVYLGRIREARSSILLLSDGWRIFEPDQNLANLAGGRKPNSPDSPSRLPGVYLGPKGLTGGGRDIADEASCTEEMIRLAQLDDRQVLRDLLTMANRNNVTFYSVNPDGLIASESLLSDPAGTPGSTPSVASQREPNPAKRGALQTLEQLNAMGNRTDSLIALANNTGGIAVVNTNDLKSGLRRVVDEVSAYYLLGYYSTNSRMDGSYRKIDVRVKRPNVKVLARRGYTASARADRSSVAGGVAGGSADVTAAFSTLGRIRPEADLFVAAAARGGEVVVVGELPYRQIQRLAKGGSATVVLTPAKGETLAPVKAPIDPGTRSVAVHVPLPAGAVGPWRARVTIAGGPDSLDEAVDLPVTTTTLIGDPIVFRGTPSARSALLPVASLLFARTERVHVEWPVLKALSDRQARLLGRNGQPIPVAIAVTERPQDGMTVLAADLVLAPLAPGDYAIELSATADAVTERKLLAFRVQ